MLIVETIARIFGRAEMTCDPWMAAPPDGILALSEALGLGRADPPAHPRGGFDLVVAPSLPARIARIVTDNAMVIEAAKPLA